jgi:large subunit ribosomal protein L15
MRLHQLKNVKGAVHRRKRVGTGEGGGRGKTSGRGGKGQTARTGGGIRIGFEGGQMPIYRRLPMRGFTNIFRVEFTPVKLGDLARVPAGVSEVTGDVLIAAGILRRGCTHFKILAGGELSRPLTIHAPRFSATAKAAIEKAGGKVVVTEPPAPEVAEEKKA